MSPQKDDNAKPFGFARTLSWVSLVLIVSSSLALSFIISNNAREALLSKQQNFALLLAENLNHQIYRQFTLPTLVGFGRIALRQPAQYKRLDDVIQATIHGLHVERLRIYDHDKVVSYDSEESDLGRTDVAPTGTDEALEGLKPTFEIAPDFSFWENMFLLNDTAGDYILRTVYPLRVENRNITEHSDGPVMGVLEITQDITGDLTTVVRFQWVIILTSLVSALLLFCILQVFIRRADRLFAERLAEVQGLQQELHQNEKLASMGRVIASIAHEIRNPLGIIRSSAELLLSRARKQCVENTNTSAPAAPKPDKVSQRILEAIYDESMRLSQTVNDFLDYARPRKPVQDTVDIDQILAQAIAFLEPELRRCHVGITRDLSDRLGPLSSQSSDSLGVLSDEPVDYLTEHLTKRDGAPNTSAHIFSCEGDKGMLYRAFYNIMVNGLQAIESKTQCPTLRRLGGASVENTSHSQHQEIEQNSITIATRRFWLDSNGREIDNSSSHEPNLTAMLELTFIDTGTGFPEDIKAKLLDPFFTTKDQGTGLGLPIVNSIITSHGGSVTLDNAPQGGALVRVVLPVKQDTSDV